MKEIICTATPFPKGVSFLLLRSSSTSHPTLSKLSRQEKPSVVKCWSESLMPWRWKRIEPRGSLGIAASNFIVYRWFLFSQFHDIVKRRRGNKRCIFRKIRNWSPAYFHRQTRMNVCPEVLKAKQDCANANVTVALSFNPILLPLSSFVVVRL